MTAIFSDAHDWQKFMERIESMRLARECSFTRSVDQCVPMIVRYSSNDKCLFLITTERLFDDFPFEKYFFLYNIYYKRVLQLLWT